MSISSTEVRVLSRLLARALALPPEKREAWLAALPEAQQVLVPRLRQRLAEVAPVAKDAAPPPPPPAAPKVDSRHGERVGPYRLISQLGRGGKGVFWLAERAEGSPKVPLALMLPPPLAGDEGAADGRDRLVVALPEHPHIARLQNAGIDQRGRPYRVMAFVPGVNLIEHAQRRRLTLDQRLALMQQVCAAVAQAHGERVAHGGLQASSLLVDDEGQVKLLDWGMGRLLHSGTAAVDIVALGAVLHELLTGAAPGARPAAKPGAAPAELRALGPDLRFVLQRALHADAAQRYKSVDELSEDLACVLGHHPVPGAPAPPWHGPQLFLRRHRVAVAAAALAAVVLALGVSGLVRQYTRGQSQAQRADLARSFLAETLREAEPAADTAQQAQRVQRALELARAGFAGEPVLRGQVLTELGMRFRLLGQPELALTVLREAHALLESTAGANDPALQRTRTEFAAQLLLNKINNGPVQAAALARQALAGCSGAGDDCTQVRNRAQEVLRLAGAPAR